MAVWKMLTGLVYSSTHLGFKDLSSFILFIFNKHIAKSHILPITSANYSLHFVLGKVSDGTMFLSNRSWDSTDEDIEGKLPFWPWPLDQHFSRHHPFTETIGRVTNLNDSNLYSFFKKKFLSLRRRKVYFVKSQRWKMGRIYQLTKKRMRFYSWIQKESRIPGSEMVGTTPPKCQDSTSLLYLKSRQLSHIQLDQVTKMSLLLTKI